MSNPDSFGPIHGLLSLRSSPLVLSMTDEQLAGHITKLRGLSSTQTLGAALNAESEAVAPRKKSSVAAKARNILADL